jgi:hypothetical protein
MLRLYFNSWLDGAQAANARTPDDPHQYGHGLVVERVAGGHFVQFRFAARSFPEEFAKELVAQLAGRGFEADSGFERVLSDIDFSRAKFEFVLASQAADEIRSRSDSLARSL